jgi:hypothetical protein
MFSMLFVMTLKTNENPTFHQGSKRLLAAFSTPQTKVELLFQVCMNRADGRLVLLVDRVVMRRRWFRRHKMTSKDRNGMNGIEATGTVSCRAFRTKLCEVLSLAILAEGIGGGRNYFVGRWCESMHALEPRHLDLEIG